MLSFKSLWGKSSLASALIMFVQYSMLVFKIVLSGRLGKFKKPNLFEQQGWAAVY